MRIPPPQATAGFTLVESIVATALVAGAAVTLASLVALGARQSANNRRSVGAIVAAQSKLEQLRAIPWRFGSESLSPSPPHSLDRDAEGFADDAHGLARRWRVAPLSPLDPNALIVSVCVYADRNAPSAEACVTTVRTRRP